MVRNIIDWVARQELGVIVGTLALVAGVWGFAKIADEVGEGDTQRVDAAIIHFVDQHRGPRWLEETARDLTGLGGVAVLTLVSLAVLGYLLMSRKFAATWLVIAAILGAMVIGMSLKAFTHRQRPSIEHRSYVYTSSFPSGHSMMSATTYLTLGILLAGLERHRAIKVYFLAVALLLSGLVGISRVYMGVHWPTDVLAGWSAGMAWALVCWLAARWLRRAGKVQSLNSDSPDSAAD